METRNHTEVNVATFTDNPAVSHTSVDADRHDVVLYISDATFDLYRLLGLVGSSIDYFSGYEHRDERGMIPENHKKTEFAGEGN